MFFKFECWECTFHLDVRPVHESSSHIWRIWIRSTRSSLESSVGVGSWNEPTDSEMDRQERPSSHCLCVYLYSSPFSQACSSRAELHDWKGISAGEEVGEKRLYLRLVSLFLSTPLPLLAWSHGAQSGLPLLTPNQKRVPSLLSPIISDG